MSVKHIPVAFILTKISFGPGTTCQSATILVIPSARYKTYLVEVLEPVQHQHKSQVPHSSRLIICLSVMHLLKPVLYEWIQVLASCPAFLGDLDS